MLNKAVDRSCCSASAPCLLCVCSVAALCLFCGCSVAAMYLLCVCSVPALWLLCACSVSDLCPFFVCTLTLVRSTLLFWTDNHVIFPETRKAAINNAGSRHDQGRLSFYVIVHRFFGTLFPMQSL